MNEVGDFRIDGFETDDTRGIVYLRYSYSNGSAFSETIEFGKALPGPADSSRAEFEAAIRALCLISGISYYKAFVPAKILVRSELMTIAQRPFFENLYRQGLGEFAFRNQVDLTNRPAFEILGPPGEDVEALPRIDPGHVASRSPPPAVLIGGGKDSLVSVEMLRSAGMPMVLLAVNPKAPILKSAEASGFDLIAIKRHLDPELFRLNDLGALNGHVPITAIVSFIAIAASYVYGFDAVILSNERSANEGNIFVDDMSINHQYSKTSSFENDIRDYVDRFISHRVSYFSLLRPLSELHIARLFARSGRYDDVFTSCNRAFRLRGVESSTRWCCDCPKCRFTFLMLANAASPERMVSIFGTNLLDDGSQLAGYEELVGLSGQKPWECVGEIEESRAAILSLSLDQHWKDFQVVRSIAARCSPSLPGLKDDLDGLYTPSQDHNLPPHYESALNEYLVEK